MLTDSNSPSTGAYLQLWSHTLFLIPPWSRRLNSETGGLEREAPSHDLRRKLGGGGLMKNQRDRVNDEFISETKFHRIKSNEDNIIERTREDHKSQSHNSMNYTSGSFIQLHLRSQPFRVLVDRLS